MTLPAPCGLEGVPRPTSQAYLEEEPPLLGDLLLGDVCYRHLVDSVQAVESPLKDFALTF